MIMGIMHILVDILHWDHIYIKADFRPPKKRIKDYSTKEKAKKNNHEAISSPLPPLPEFYSSICFHRGRHMQNCDHKTGELRLLRDLFAGGTEKS